MTVYYIPIEPLEERYTEQWYKWFPIEFEKAGVKCITIDGETLTDVIETGTFLDVNSTVFYKSEQLKRISQLFYKKKVKPNDVFFVADIEFWGIEVIKYLSVLNDVPVKLYGFCHAASYTREDFMAKTEPFAKLHENAWFNTFDKVFVGSDYHRNQIIKLRDVDLVKIINTGNPYIIPDYMYYQKKNQIVLTNRPDYEKRPNLTLDVFEILKDKHPYWNFVVTTGRKEWGSGWIRKKALLLQQNGVIDIRENLSKNQYFSILQESKVMTGNSIEENFGYCILEALMFDTIPIIPNDYSHAELLEQDSNCLFNTIEEQIKQIENVMPAPFHVYEYTEKYKDSFNKIVSECLID
jgi:glycosyltransferase involved in cell wall biosynthesis